MAAKYEIKKSSSGKFYFNLKAGNGEVVLTSEQYTAKQSAQGGIASVKVNSSLDERYERKTSSAGDPYFTLKAANGEPLGRSETYSSTSAMENGIASVKKNGPTAETADLSDVA